MPSSDLSGKKQRTLAAGSALAFACLGASLILELKQAEHTLKAGVLVIGAATMLVVALVEFWGLLRSR